MDRRRFLKCTAGTALGVALAQCTREQGPQPLRSPIASQDGLFSINLTASEQTVQVAGRSAQLLAYNQQVPGPLWEINAGDTVEINFRNQLATPTNLHFHGLHIPPTGTADNPFLSIPTGESQIYRFQIPEQHPGGLFWYHPHHHGSVAEQVFGGLAGAIIVRGTVDSIPEIKAAEEAVLVLQDFDLSRQGKRQDAIALMKRLGRQGSLITINGGRAPDLFIPQGGLTRLRILNASPSRIYRLRLENHPWHLIGLDGGTLPEPVELETDLILAPGNRADLLVAGDRPAGQYSLLSLPYDRGITEMLSGLDQAADTIIQSQPIPIASLTYGEAQSSVPLPKALIPFQPLSNPMQRREFVFDHGIDGHQSFLINGRGFNHHRVDTTVSLGSVEDWVITNRAGMDHPFHIHTNAFQVLRQNGKPAPLTVWQDVVNVKAYESVELRMAFTDFPGKTVYHCHILDHEDQGMMAILDIQA